MKNEKIIAYIREQEQITVPMLQRQFSISYVQAKAVVDDLAGKGKLVYDSGITYNVRAEKPKTQSRTSSRGKPSHTEGEEDNALSSYLKMRRRFFEESDKSSHDEDNSGELTENEKKALWICIQNNSDSHFPVARKLGIGTLEAYMIINKLSARGYFSRGSLKVPTLTAGQFIEKFGEVEIDDDESPDGGTGDKDGGADAPTGPVNFYELFRIKKIINDCIDKRVQSKRAGSASFSILEIDENRNFKLTIVNDNLRISDRGAAFNACRNTDKGMAILKEFKTLYYDFGEIAVTVQDRTQVLSALFDLYEAVERIKKAE